MFDAPQSARARVEFDPNFSGLRAVLLPHSDTVMLWPLSQTRHRLAEGAEPVYPADLTPWLRLDEQVARALYQALGEFFGYAGNDVRALRKDYDAERARVDKLITHLTETSPLVIERQAE